MKNTKKGFLNTLYGIGGQLVIMAFAFLMPKLVIENYGSEVNGLLHSAAQMVSYLALFEAGVGAATIQALYAPVAKGETGRISAIMAATGNYYRKTGIIYAAGVGMIALVFPLVIPTELPYGMAAAIVLFSGLGGCLSFFYQGKYELLMQAEGYSYVSTKIEILVNILINLTKYILLTNGANVLVVQIADFLVCVVRMLVYSVYIRRRYRWVDLRVVSDMKAVAQKNAVLVHQISSLVFSSTDVVLLSLLLKDLKIVSVYTLYYAIVTAVYNLIGKLTAGFDFRFGQIFNTDREKYSRVYHLMEIVNMAAVFSVMSALYVVLLPFMAIYTRNVTDISYLGRWYPLLFVAVPILNHGRQAANSTIAYSGHYTQTKKYSIIESVINIAVSVPCILWLGMPGALVGTIAALVYRTGNMVNYTYKYLITGNRWSTVRRWMFCLAVFALVVVLDGRITWNITNYFQVALLGAASGIVLLAVYGLGLYATNREERGMVRDLLKKGLGSVLARLGKKAGKEKKTSD